MFHLKDSTVNRCQQLQLQWYGTPINFKQKTKNNQHLRDMHVIIKREETTINSKQKQREHIRVLIIGMFLPLLLTAYWKNFTVISVYCNRHKERNTTLNGASGTLSIHILW